MSPLLRIISLLCVLFSLHRATAYDLSTLHSRLSPGAEIIVPSDPAFVNETVRWQENFLPTYKVIVKVGVAADVPVVINFANQCNVPFLAITGAHGWSKTLATFTNGFGIDMRALTNVDIDTSANTMTFGGGILIEQAIDALYKVGKVFTSGTCNCVGVMGATLGAGQGRFQGIHGYALDNLLSADLVLASGETITVSETSYSDLFWGIRGAGHNFGIVTGATVRIFDSSPTGAFFNVDAIIPKAGFNGLFTYFNATTLPPPLTILATVVWNATTAEAEMIINFSFIGTEAEGLPYIQPFLAFGAYNVLFEEIAYNKLWDEASYNSGAYICANNNVFSQQTVGLKEFNGTTLDVLTADFEAMIREHPALSASNLLFEFYASQAVQAVPDDATAYPNRDFKGNSILVVGSTNATIPDSLQAYGTRWRSILQASSGFCDLNTYVNYARGDETVSQIYQPRKLPRLEALKKKYDPNNAFRFFHPLV